MTGHEFTYLRKAAGMSLRDCAAYFENYKTGKAHSKNTVVRWGNGDRQVPSEVADELRSIVLRKDLEKMSRLIDTGKETFLISAIFAVAGRKPPYYRLNLLMSAVACGFVMANDPRHYIHIEERKMSPRLMSQRLRNTLSNIQNGICVVKREGIPLDEYAV